MCGNRVEELESRVKELEASVEGLTDELVECKVRLRELESAVDDDLGFVPEDEAEQAPESTETEEESGEDIRVPEPGKSAEADTSNTEATESEDNTEDSGSDIIVA
jgi:uncharacterized coiled-coil protein SlyX